MLLLLLLLVLLLLLLQGEMKFTFISVNRHIWHLVWMSVQWMGKLDTVINLFVWHMAHSIS